MKFLKYGIFTLCVSLFGNIQSLSVNEKILNKQKVPATTNFLQKAQAESRTGCVDEDNTKFIIGCEQEKKEACAEKVHCTHIESNNCLFITENDCFEKGFSQCKQIVIFFDESMGAELPSDAKIIQLIPQQSLFNPEGKTLELPEDYIEQAFVALKSSNGENMEVHSTSEMEAFKKALLSAYEEQKQAQIDKASKTSKDVIHDQIVQKAITGITSGANLKVGY